MRSEVKVTAEVVEGGRHIGISFENCRNMQEAQLLLVSGICIADKASGVDPTFDRWLSLWPTYQAAGKSKRPSKGTAQGSAPCRKK